jgi:hypothetical protein
MVRTARKLLRIGRVFDGPGPDQLSDIRGDDRRWRVTGTPLASRRMNNKTGPGPRRNKEEHEPHGDQGQNHEGSILQRFESRVSSEVPPIVSIS